ncbi:MAG TPA: ABC transporter ATP-binding protein [Thermodesulfobacteriota bacterium]|nr:ABC transporter ATP-binding protein [Thermodesulfobacteriota bacterium]
MENILEINNLTISIGDKETGFEVVSNASIAVPKGKIIGIVGESGCGKTITALSIMKLLPDPPAKITSGEIIFKNKNILEISDEELRDIRGNEISMIFQEPVSSLNPVFTIGEQIGETIRTHNDINSKDEREKVIELLKLVGIPEPERRYSNYPHEMSGGMCQRVMIAMALCCSPDLLIADEPTTALDVTVEAGIIDLIDNLRKDLGMSVILITHDLGIISEIADEVYVMYAGRIVEHAQNELLFSNPKHPYTVGLLNSIPDLADTDKRDLKMINGNIPSPKNYPKGCRFNDRCELVIEKCKVNVPVLEKLEEKHESACFRSKEVNF